MSPSRAMCTRRIVARGAHLPHKQAQGVCQIIPSVGLHLHVLANHVGTQPLLEVQVVDHRLLSGVGVHSLRNETLCRKQGRSSTPTEEQELLGPWPFSSMQSISACSLKALLTLTQTNGLGTYESHSNFISFSNEALVG